MKQDKGEVLPQIEAADLHKGIKFVGSVTGSMRITASCSGNQPAPLGGVSPSLTTGTKSKWSKEGLSTVHFNRASVKGLCYLSKCSDH